jgi:hypothetical protein
MESLNGLARAFAARHPSLLSTLRARLAPWPEAVGVATLDDGHLRLVAIADRATVADLVAPEGSFIAAPLRARPRVGWLTLVTLSEGCVGCIELPA